MRVREATEEDRQAVFALHVAAARRLDTDRYTDEQLRAWARKDGGPEAYPVADPDRHLVVAEREGDVLGYGELDRSEGEVIAVYVHPDHQGSGVGSALLSHLEAVAEREGFDRLHLTASLNAVEFYEARGWERVERVTHDTGGVDLPCVRMQTTV